MTDVVVVVCGFKDGLSSSRSSQTWLASLGFHTYGSSENLTLDAR